MENPCTDQQRINRATEYVYDMLKRNSDYHHHKESSAFTGLTLFAGVAISGAVSDLWPPHWGPNSAWWAFGAATLLWVMVLGFLCFQLSNRRCAALRVAACEQLLASWLNKPPSGDDLILSDSTLCPDPGCCDKVIKCFCKTRNEKSSYPHALVKAFDEAKNKGTSAVFHERLTFFSGWVLYLILVITAFIRCQH